MCLAIPGKIIEIKNEMAKIEIGGIQRTISIMLVPNLKLGDYVITHAGFALHKIEELEALASLNILKKLANIPSFKKLKK